jgi:hypothetical protein
MGAESAQNPPSIAWNCLAAPAGPPRALVPACSGVGRVRLFRRNEAGDKPRIVDWQGGDHWGGIEPRLDERMNGPSALRPFYGAEPARSCEPRKADDCRRTTPDTSQALRTIATTSRSGAALGAAFCSICSNRPLRPWAGSGADAPLRGFAPRDGCCYVDPFLPLPRAIPPVEARHGVRRPAVLQAAGRFASAHPNLRAARSARAPNQLPRRRNKACAGGDCGREAAEKGLGCVAASRGNIDHLLVDRSACVGDGRARSVGSLAGSLARENFLGVSRGVRARPLSWASRPREPGNERRAHPPSLGRVARQDEERYFRAGAMARAPPPSRGVGRGAPIRPIIEISIAPLHVLASGSPLAAPQHHIPALLRRSVGTSIGHFDVTNQVAERGDDAGRSPLADGPCGL